MAQNDLPYRVELWDEADKHVDEVIALAGDFGVARAAFEEEAIRRRPGKIVTLRQNKIVGTQQETGMTRIYINDHGNDEK